MARLETGFFTKFGQVVTATPWPELLPNRPQKAVGSSPSNGNEQSYLPKNLSPTLMLSKAEQSAALAEILDPQKIQVYCGLHQYFGPNTNAKKPPKFDCPRCWFVYFLVDIATTPPSHRAQRLDELESVIHHLVEAAEKGSFDFTPFARAKIEFSKEDDPKVVLTEGD